MHSTDWVQSSPLISGSFSTAPNPKYNPVLGKKSRELKTLREYGVHRSTLIITNVNVFTRRAQDRTLHYVDWGAIEALAAACPAEHPLPAHRPHTHQDGRKPNAPTPKRKKPSSSRKDQKHKKQSTKDSKKQGREAKQQPREAQGSQGAAKGQPRDVQDQDQDQEQARVNQDQDLRAARASVRYQARQG